MCLGMCDICYMMQLGNQVVFFFVCCVGEVGCWGDFFGVYICVDLFCYENVCLVYLFVLNEICVVGQVDFCFDGICCWMEGFVLCVWEYF